MLDCPDHSGLCLNQASPWRRTSGNGDMTEAGSKLGKPPTPTPTPAAAQEMEAQNSTDERLSPVHQPEC